MAPSPSRFLIWGAGGHGKVVADLVRACGHELVGFIDADPAKLGSPVEPGGARVVLRQEDFLERAFGEGYPEGIDAVALAIGDNAARQGALARLAGRCVPPLAHPAAVVSPSASLGRGTVVFPAAVLNADAVLGGAVVVNSGAVVEHDCRVSDGVHLAPRATIAGGVRVGERTWVGAGATVLQGVVIGSDAMIGAGAVVIRDVPDGCTVAGVPAVPIRG